MKHCIEFEPIDIWFLKDNDEFTQRKLDFGICPMCNKPVAILIQFNSIKDEYSKIKKIGISAQKFVQSLKKQIKYSLSNINKSKFEPATYRWVYGVNIETKKCIKQYSKDFYGNKSLIKSTPKKTQ